MRIQKMNLNAPALITYIGALVLVLLAPLAQAAEVSGVCGVYPADEGAYIAVVIEHGEDESLSGLSWFNNDGQQPFSGVVLVEGQPGEAPDLSGGALVLGEVWGLSSDWSQLSLEQPVVSSTGLIHAVFVIPAGGVRTGEGAFGGPGIGYENDGSGLVTFVSADGFQWSPFHEDYGLAVQPALNVGSGKTKPMELGKLASYLGPKGDEKILPEDRPEAPKTALLGARPNPFNPRTEIRFSLEREGPVQIVVYDARGRRVRTLVSETRGAGIHSVMWLGRDDNAGTVASGVYYVKMDFAGRTISQAITLVR